MPTINQLKSLTGEDRVLKGKAIHGPKPKQKPKTKCNVQPKRTMQRNRLFPVDLECFSHMLTSTSWWSSQE